MSTNCTRHHATPGMANCSCRDQFGPIAEELHTFLLEVEGNGIGGVVQFFDWIDEATAHDDPNRAPAPRRRGSISIADLAEFFAWHRGEAASGAMESLALVAMDYAVARSFQRAA